MVPGEPVNPATLEASFHRLFAADSILTADTKLETGLGSDDRMLIASVLDLLTEGFVLFDENLRFVFCNQTYRDLYDKINDLLVPGTPFEEMVRASIERGQFSVLGPSDYVAERLTLMDNADGSHEQQLADGRWVRVAERRLRNGWVLGTRTDITEAKQRERAREISEQRLVDSIATLQEGFALFDVDDRLVVCNEKYKSYFPLIRKIIEPGVRFEELIRRAAEQGQNVESMTDPAPWIEARLNAHARASGTFEHQFSDGRHVWVAERKTKDGSTVSTYVDITQLKLREKELEHSSMRAEQASLAKGEFLAKMSHEFRTPLNAIIGFSEVISREMMGPLENDQYRGYITNIFDSSRHLLQMVNDLLDFERIEANKFSLAEETIDLASIVDSSIAMLSQRAESGRVVLRSRIGKPGPRLRLDELAIRKALLNIVTNAIKFTPAEGVVEVTCDRIDNGDVAIRVTDTGVGIDAEDLKQIPGPFVQVGKTKNAEGTGLGLAITKSLVVLHGGALDIASEPGRGTTVTITLPQWRVVSEEQKRQRHKAPAI